MTTSMDTPESEASPANKGPHFRHFARVCALQLLFQLDLNTDWQMDVGKWLRFWQQVYKFDDAPEDEKVLLLASEYAEKLVSGVIGCREQLDQQLGAVARNWTLTRMSVIDRNILRLAAFEMQFVTEVPQLVAIDEAVELAKQFGDRHSSRFVNGILDQLLPERGLTG